MEIEYVAINVLIITSYNVYSLNNFDLLFCKIELQVATRKKDFTLITASIFYILVVALMYTLYLKMKQPKKHFTLRYCDRCVKYKYINIVTLQYSIKICNT